jgi:glutamate/tyrosine decarboxylase-like PLP-dependent enzyme
MDIHWNFLKITHAASVCADQAHSSVERAGLLGGVKLRLLHADDNLRLRGDKLEHAIQEDRRNGLIPFYVSTVGLLHWSYRFSLQSVSGALYVVPSD